MTPGAGNLISAKWRSDFDSISSIKNGGIGRVAVTTDQVNERSESIARCPKADKPFSTNHYRSELLGQQPWMTRTEGGFRDRL